MKGKEFLGHMSDFALWGKLHFPYHGHISFALLLTSQLPVRKVALQCHICSQSLQIWLSSLWFYLNEVLSELWFDRF
jgi:hypothetical protein